MNTLIPSLDQFLQRLAVPKLLPMQEQVLQAAHQQEDLILLAPTGSGKTLAFLLPLLAQLDPNKTGVQVLILAPARELALQITQVFQTMQTGFTVYCCYGGHALKTEQQRLSQSAPTILVGTPGRIEAHLRSQHLDPSSIQHWVLDEFDKLLEFGFKPSLSYIRQQLPQLEQQLLTSATNLEPIPDFLQLEQAKQLDFTKKTEESQLQIKGVVTSSKDRRTDFLRLVQWLGHAPCLIFCNQRRTVEAVSQQLDAAGIVHDCFHGGLTQDDRELALLKFRNGSHQILVTTDLAARGLDIPSIQHIIHYQLPHTEAEFIHRNGRTARMNATGSAYLLLEADRPWRQYIDDYMEYVELPKELPALPSPDWATLYVSVGRQDKISKFDLVGTFLKKGGLAKDELGLVVLQDRRAYVAVPRKKATQIIKKLNKQAIKKKKVRIELAR